MSLDEFISANLDKINIDRKVFMTLWGIIENGEWIYASKEVVHEQFGYKNGDNMMSDFHRKLSREFENNFDYKKVGVDHNLVKSHKNSRTKDNRGGSSKKFYIITKKTYIMLLCRSKTQASLRYAEYFYEIQNLVVQYYKYYYSVHNKYDDCKDKLTQMLSNDLIKKYTLSQDIKYLDMTVGGNSKIGAVYFINEDSDLNYFKIGFTYDIQKRLSELQTSNRRKLAVYKYIYCSNPSCLETIIHQKLAECVVLGEWYKIDVTTINELIAELKD